MAEAYNLTKLAADVAAAVRTRHSSLITLLRGGTYGRIVQSDKAGC